MIRRNGFPFWPAALSLLFSAIALSSPSNRAQDSIIRNAPPGEVMRGMLSNRKALVTGADGRVWALTWHDDKKTGSPDKDRHLWLCSSTDGGKSWAAVQDTRTIGDTYGSLTVGPLGRRLHVVWYANNGKKVVTTTGTIWITSVYYATFDTRTNQWEGSADTVIRAGQSDRERYSDPDVLVTADDHVFVSFGNRYVTPTASVGAPGSWNTYLVWNKGKGWSQAHRVNIDYTGIGTDLHYNRWAGRVEMAYRVNTGGYGTAYRHFDIATEKFGPEIHIPQLKGATGRYHGNRNHLTIVGQGDIWVLYVRNKKSVSPNVSEIRVALLPRGSTAFTQDYHVATDNYGLGGNVSSYHYSLSTLPNGTIWALYSLQKENNQHLYGRVIKTTGLSPQLTLRKGATANLYNRVTGHRPMLQGGGLHAMITDTSAIGPLTGGRNVYLGPVTGTVLHHGTGCGSSSIAAPILTPLVEGNLGANLSLLATRHPANTSGILILGVNSRQFGPFKLPLSLDGLGMTGCQLWQNILTSGIYPCDKNGEATLTLPIPSLQSLAGLPIFFQSLVVAPSANKASLLTSNGLASILR